MSSVFWTSGNVGFSFRGRLFFHCLLLLLVKFTSLYAPSVLSMLQNATSKHISSPTAVFKDLLNLQLIMKLESVHINFAFVSSVYFFHSISLSYPSNPREFARLSTTEYHINQSFSDHHSPFLS